MKKAVDPELSMAELTVLHDRKICKSQSEAQGYMDLALGIKR